MQKLRFFALLLFGFLGITFLGNNYPINEINNNTEYIIGIFRILYSVLLILKLVNGWKAIPLIAGWENESLVQKYYLFWILNSILICFGLFTFFCCIINFLFCFFIWRKQKEYSVEELLFRLVAFHLIFLNSGKVLSLDEYFAINISILSTNLVVLNLFILNILLAFFSAGFEKINSSVWRKGLGFYYFVAIPHFVNPKFKILKKNLYLCILFNWLTIIIELLGFLTLFDPRINILFLIGLLLFSISLFIIVDLSYIGQISALLVTFLISLNYQSWPDSIFNRVTTFQVEFTYANFPFYFLWILTIVECLYYKPFSTKFGSWIVTASTALVPLIVFNSVHYFGLYLFRLRGENDGDYYTALNVFNDDGTRGKMQIWKPRNYQNAMYSITDLCIAYIKNIPERIKWREPQIIDLCYVARKELSEKNIFCSKIYLDVKVLNPSKSYVRSTSKWLSSSWQNIGYTDFDKDKPTWSKKGNIPKYAYTKRWPVQNKITNVSDYR